MTPSPPADSASARRPTADPSDSVRGGFPDGFKPISLIGDGPICELWQAQAASDGRIVAIKRVRFELAADRDARLLFSNEARVVASVASEWVAKFESANIQDGRPYLVLEWLDGQSLETRLAEHEILRPVTAVWIARQCVQALVDIAAAGFSHGDLKPANIMLLAGGGLKLIDLGFARSVVMKRSPAPARRLMGTAEYMAPEELSKGDYNPLTKDLYSLGVILFRMLTGRLPFRAENTAEMLRLQRQGRPPRLSDLKPHAPDALDHLLHRLLAKQPIRRPQSLTGLVHELVDLELELIADARRAA